MEGRTVLLVHALGLLLVFYIGSSQGKSIEKRSSEEAGALHLETELRRVKRLDEDPGLSRTKRRDFAEDAGLSRVKRQNFEDGESLSREKRRNLEDEELSREKRNELEEDPGLSREKRGDLNKDGLLRVKRDDILEDGLSRQKRQDLNEGAQLVRVKREEEGLMRVKRVDTDLPELSRMKRREEPYIRRRRNSDANGEKKEVQKKAKTSLTDGPEKKAHVELEVSKSKSSSLEKKSEKMAQIRKRGYWEKRTRGDYLLHRANKRGKYHKRRYMNKRGRARFMKRKSFLAKQKIHREANQKVSEKDFVKKSLVKNHQ